MAEAQKPFLIGAAAGVVMLAIAAPAVGLLWKRAAADRTVIKAALAEVSDRLDKNNAALEDMRKAASLAGVTKQMEELNARIKSTNEALAGVQKASLDNIRDRLEQVEAGVKSGNAALAGLQKGLAPDGMSKQLGQLAANLTALETSLAGLKQAVPAKGDAAANIEEKKRLEADFSKWKDKVALATRDQLTGLLNRRAFFERAENAFQTARTERHPLAAVMLDIDHFKRVNDVYGHLAGDQVLAALGNTLRAAIRREDAVARYGGEEFAVLLPNTSIEQATLVGRKVREAASQIVVNHNGQSIAITVSGGLATIQANEQVESLIQRADAALYAAKSGGRNCAYVHDGTVCRPADGRPSEAAGRRRGALEDCSPGPGTRAPGHRSSFAGEDGPGRRSAGCGSPGRIRG